MIIKKRASSKGRLNTFGPWIPEEAKAQCPRQVAKISQLPKINKIRQRLNKRQRQCLQNLRGGQKLKIKGMLNESNKSARYFDMPLF